ncbi:MAG: Holliday junction branch migration protein RuvA [Phycisphaerae bacterium]
MIVRITGLLVEVYKDSVVVTRDGLGREVLVPGFALAELAASRGKEVTLHTMEFLEGNITAGALTPRMVGFPHPEDREFFQRFTGVKGIGTRKALKALTEPVRRVGSWIEAGDGKALATLPGIGKRAAELIIATLRGKLGDLALETGEGADVTEFVSLSQGQRDALEVLVAWGDSRSDAQRWLQRAGQLYPDLESPDEIVRMAYRVKIGAEV